MSWLTNWFKNRKSNTTKKLRVNYFTLSYQLRDALWLTLIGAFCFSIMGLLLYMALRRSAEQASDVTLAMEIMDKTFNLKSILLGYEVSVPLFVFLSFLFSMGIVATHRIAGPIFAIKRHMNRVRSKALRKPLVLRKDDILQDVASSMNHMLTMLWRNEEEVLRRVKMAEDAIKVSDTAEAQKQLSALKRLLEDNMSIAVPENNVVVLGAASKENQSNKNQAA